MSGLALRQIEPEILDQLPETDPRAVASRRDLKRVNAIMAQARITASLLRANLVKPPRRILEIGAGDGTFMLKVAERLAPDWRDIELVLVDRLHLVSDTSVAAFGALGWKVRPVQADVFAYLDENADQSFDAVTANLFLHHFNDGELCRLFAGLSQIAPVFVTTEPLRGSLPLLSAGMLWAIGANDVTRHDAAVSVRAGFAGEELSALWPQEPPFELQERRRGLFTQAFVARRSEVAAA
ncbi:methyltransferase domain-containing protein [Afifella aestuarii]|uniref:methyltransferase domain-containing protein n=1 Tax=Afifella aestuarii TaxID=1909496 RepID=UPI000FE442FF|nr:methyltransferase domain-containing protein [Afifella aestuarii]